MPKVSQKQLWLMPEMSSKCCSVCEEVKALEDFGTNNALSDGKMSSCLQCSNARARKWRADNPEVATAVMRRSEARRDRAKANARKREWYKRESSRVLTKNAEYRARKLNATPPYADQDAISFVYHAAQVIKDTYGTDWHVDHIVPLQGENVCGLHVANNLQLLTPSQNLSKSNKFEAG